MAAMLPETSKARMTVPCSRGSATTAWGRASATAIMIMPPTTRAPAIALAGVVRPAPLPVWAPLAPPVAAPLRARAAEP